MLKNFISTSPNQHIRSSAVYWLGQVGGEQTFLASLVRNETEDIKLRRSAAHAIGQSRDRGAIATIQDLYREVKDVEIRRSLISAAGNSVDEQPAFTFLLGVAKQDTDWESRRVAVRQLGHFHREDAVEELMKIYASDANVEVKRAALRSLAETKSPRAQARLLDAARTETNPDLRKQAIRVLAERGEAAVDDLLKLFDSETAPEVKREVVRSLSQIAGKRSFDFLSATAQSTDGNVEVQVQAVRSIGERHAQESVPLLIKIAKTHPNQMVRKQAIRSLGESGDPRAVEFFREVLSNK
jgi:HEAT repeat protein